MWWQTDTQSHQKEAWGPSPQICGPDRTLQSESFHLFSGHYPGWRYHRLGEGHLMEQNGEVNDRVVRMKRKKRHCSSAREKEQRLIRRPWRQISPVAVGPPTHRPHCRHDEHEQWLTQVGKHESQSRALCLRKTSSHIRSVRTAGELTDQLTSEVYGKDRRLRGEAILYKYHSTTKDYPIQWLQYSVTRERRHARTSEANLSDLLRLDQLYCRDKTIVTVWYSTWTHHIWFARCHPQQFQPRESEWPALFGWP